MDLSDLGSSMPRPSRYAPSVPTSGSGCRPPGNSGPRSTSWLQPGIGRGRELEPDLFGVTVEPKVGIGQQAHLVRTPAGNLLWDVPGYLDDYAVQRVRQLGGVAAIVASHPHHFACRWSGAGAGRRAGAGLRAEHGMGLAAGSGDPSVGRQARSLARDHVGPAGRTLPGQRGRTLGGWRRRQRRSVRRGHDPDEPGPCRRRSCVATRTGSRSPAVVERIVRAVEEFSFDRLYDNFGNTIDTDARAAVRRSADRYIGWVRGDFDHLT